MPYDVIGFDTSMDASAPGVLLRPGGIRSFENLEDAVLFVMEEIPDSHRPPVVITSDEVDDMDIDAIQAHYRAMRNTI